jgi:hypothetical protein
MSEKYIHFIANYDDWIAIRKLKVEPATEPITIMEFLAGLTTSVDTKVEQNLRKIIELEKLDKAIQELELGKKDFAKALESINSRGISSAIKEICAKPELQKNVVKELEDFCKTYATKKALKQCGLKADYSEIEIPGMKRTKKVKA